LIHHVSQSPYSLGPHRNAQPLEGRHDPGRAQHYEHKFIYFADLKKEPFESINPNGRLPAIEDPNTGISAWESGAILEYLVDIYDKGHNISFAAGSKEYYETKQWLHY
jgi:glutathione S-transferase